ncbi:MAG: tripartite tricarboxylate transporter substrate binding protein [Rhodocyclaceae bacterium]|nr:tripartite tricarboxylate transporter substrate binding protein [Rhodocyclaceae bacterium]MCA3075945.1 tripartite tricarboxylate transporter substrate binding protein [Rhodocyclaceae bacterium]MCA3088525.1 tripartite tricarboxylate transporter substrate binding protein [Rhodocyclaceae bacterium]MCA3094425.1 tripartite tricarboxylate transporter substrate binding protein [Rhodocyclaceae bacterium]MCA3099997.1 tripartite tricarboxylate transporter substrate binding protein [Rhodocyclaceae bact
MKRRDLLAAGAASLIAPWANAQSQAWPTRGPIRLICQFPPGGLVDTVARLIAPHLQQALSQTVLVENRPGAGGLVGTDFAARQNPDGYSLLVSHASVHVYATATRNKMPFDAIADFTHMAMLVEAPMVLLVRPQSPFKTLADYVAAARVKPVRYGSSGIGSANHLFGEMLKIEGNAPMHDHVPYQGSAPALAELLGGQIDSVLDPITTNVDQLKGGSLRALAVSTPARLPGLPDIPTFAEAGFPSLTGSQWLGLSAPKGLPAPIAQRLTTLMPEILARPDIMKRLDDLQTLPRKAPVTGAEFNKLIESQITTWTAVARRAKVEVIG